MIQLIDDVQLGAMPIKYPTVPYQSVHSRFTCPTLRATFLKMSTVSRKSRVSSELVLAAAKEFIEHQKNINPRVKPSKFCQKYGISPQTLAKAVKRIGSKNLPKYFSLSSTKSHELQNELKRKFESGEELSKDLVINVAYSMNGNVGPTPSKSWCHNFLKKYHRVCLLYTSPSPRD